VFSRRYCGLIHPCCLAERREPLRQGGGGGRNSKRNRVQTPAFLLKVEVEGASAKDDVAAGLAAFERAVTVSAAPGDDPLPPQPGNTVGG
jgi:hypothetical protein